MKKACVFIMLFATIVMLSGCTKSIEEEIVGVWTWTYAQNSNGDNLMLLYDYNTATFNADGTYVFDIGSTSHAADYTIDEENETITIDGGVWDILQLTSSSLQIKHQEGSEYEFHFEK